MVLVLHQVSLSIWKKSRLCLNQASELHGIALNISTRKDNMKTNRNNNSNENHTTTSSRSKAIRFLLVSIFLAAVVILSGCSSKVLVSSNRRPTAIHGQIFKGNDYSKKCTWHFFNSYARKKCVRK